MIKPDIQKYSNLRSYLIDVYELNKVKGGAGSFRYYAIKLKWPISYFNELLKGKKKMSLRRTLEFGLFLKLDAVDIERMVYLCLRDEANSIQRKYFDQKLNNEARTDGFFEASKNPQIVDDQNMQVVPSEIYQDISLLAIYDIVQWSQGQITPKDIAEYLYTFPELKEKSAINDKIAILESAGYIEPLRKDGEIVAFKKPQKRLFFSVDSKTVVHMGQYADNLKRFLVHPHQRGWVGSGFIHIHKNQLPVVKKRILALRNWLLALDGECLSRKKETLSESLLFQADVNLVCIIDGVALGVPRLNDWMAQ